LLIISEGKINVAKANDRIIAGLLVASGALARADDDAERRASRCALSPFVIGKIQNQLSAAA
jgi:hypothetical protein